MLKYGKIFGLVIFISLFAMCNQKDKNESEKDTILKGRLSKHTVINQMTLASPPSSLTVAPAARWRRSWRVLSSSEQMISRYEHFSV